MEVTLVAAADRAWGIGRAGGLPWHSPADLNHFRQRTMGRTLLMGRSTRETLPSSLPGRRIVVISGSGNGDYTSLADAMSALSEAEEVIVAGGGQIYRAALPFCTHAEITRIAGQYDCDTFMPNLETAGWCLQRMEAKEQLELEFWTKS